MRSAASWLDDFFDHYYRRRPVSATFIGVHDYDHELPDYSLEGVARTMGEMRSLVSQLEAGEVGHPDDVYEEIDCLLAGNYLRQQLWELESDHFQRANPCFYTGEAIFGIISLFLRDFAPIEERARAAVSRMLAIPEFLRQGREFIVESPTEWIERAIDECVGAEHLLSEGARILVDCHGVDHPNFLPAADVARAAFEDYKRHLGSMLHEGRVRERVAIGREAFDRLLRDGHLLALDSGAVERYARDRLVAARELLDEEIARNDDVEDWPDVARALASRHPLPGSYYEAFIRVWRSARDHATEHDLLTWPDFPIVFEPIPDWVRSAAPYLYFLHYRSPAPLDPQVLQRYLVPPLSDDMTETERQQVLRATNDCQIKLNHVIHHAGIGHHVQNYHAFRSRSRVGQVAGVDTSLRIAMFSAGTIVEGWACYATDLMHEAGFLTPLEALSLHHSRVRVAARAVVDVNLHTGAFSIDDALAFYVCEAGMGIEAARAEAVKNSMFPGAAMMYLIGTDMIHDLRGDLRCRWGGAFSLRRFHDTLLSYGSIPVALVVRLMRDEPLVLRP